MSGYLHFASLTFLSRMSTFSHVNISHQHFSTIETISTSTVFVAETAGIRSNRSEGMAEVEYLAHVVVMPVVLGIGMANQCLNVATLWQLQSGCFLYLKASALLDILSIVSFIPFILRHAGLSNDRSYPLMFYHAHFELPIINGLICASALCIVAMTVDRYMSVCHPIHFFNSLDSAKRAPKVIFSLLLLAIIVYFPSIWQKELAEVDDGYQIFYVIERHPGEKTIPFEIYLCIRELISRWGPMFTLVVLNSAMMRSLYQLDRKPSRRSIRSRTGRTSRDETGRISVLLLITSTTFVLCNLPASLLSIFIRQISHDSIFWQTFKAIANLLQVTSYLYNFYLYALCSSEYRAALKRLLKLERRSSHTSTDDSPTFKMSTNVARHLLEETAPLREIS